MGRTDPLPAASLRLLDPVADFEAVVAVYDRSMDFVRLERGDCAPEDAAHAFFDERPPKDGVRCDKMGVVGADGGLDGLVDLAFDYPDAGDVFLGLLMLMPQARGAGLGGDILERVKTIARDAGARRLLLGVLDDNPRARAFWQRQGFGLEATRGPFAFGTRSHLVHRLVLRLG